MSAAAALRGSVVLSRGSEHCFWSKASVPGISATPVSWVNLGKLLIFSVTIPLHLQNGDIPDGWGSLSEMMSSHMTL